MFSQWGIAVAVWGRPPLRPDSNIEKSALCRMMQAVQYELHVWSVCSIRGRHAWQEVPFALTEGRLGQPFRGCAGRHGVWAT